MNNELKMYAAQLNENFSGEPWFGRNIQAILKEINEDIASQKPNGQHSILELLYHMINWRLFTINRLEKSTATVKSFEENDWQVLDHQDISLWQKGIDQLNDTQQRLLNLINTMKDEDLQSPVHERDYENRTLINGIIQHDIYHLGQIAYIKKMLS